MNPQALPLLMQKEMGPAQAQYAQQQAAFEQAMLGRREALQAGTSLAAAGIRSDAAVDAAKARGQQAAKGQMRFVEDPAGTGEMVLQEFVPDGQGGFTPGKVLAKGADSLRFLATTQGWLPASARTGLPQGNYVAAPGGGAALPPPPAGAAMQVAGQTAALGTIGTIKDVWTEFSKQARGPAMLQGAAQYGLERFPGTTRTIMPEQDYNVQAQYKARLDNAILKYVNSLSGKQYTIQELEKFRGLFPNIYDPEATVDEKLESLRQAVQRELGAIQQQYPATKKGGSLDERFEEWRKRNAP